MTRPTGVQLASMGDAGLEPATSAVQGKTISALQRCFMKFAGWLGRCSAGRTRMPNERMAAFYAQAASTLVAGICCSLLPIP